MRDYSDISPDWDFWGQARNVTLVEAVALSLNVEPKLLRPHSSNPDGGGIAMILFPTPKMEVRLDLASRNLNHALVHSKNGRSSPTISIRTFAEWAIALGWEIPEQLRQQALDPSESIWHWAELLAPIKKRPFSLVLSELVEATIKDQLLTSAPLSEYHRQRLKALTEELHIYYAAACGHGPPSDWHTIAHYTLVRPADLKIWLLSSAGLPHSHVETLVPEEAPLRGKALEAALLNWVKQRWGDDIAKLPGRDELLRVARASFPGSSVNQGHARSLRRQFATAEAKRGGGGTHRPKSPRL